MPRLGVLAIDPGITTGFALLDLDGVIVGMGEIQPDEIDRLKLFSQNPDIEVVMEYTPIPTLSEMNMVLRDVIARLRVMFPRHLEIKPGQWKQTPVIRHSVPNRWEDEPVTHHMRDAVRLGIYYLTFVRSTK